MDSCTCSCNIFDMRFRIMKKKTQINEQLVVCIFLCGMGMLSSVNHVSAMKYNELYQLFFNFLFEIGKRVLFDSTTQSLLLTTQRNLSKTLWEKEKMLVTSIFSFSLNVLY